MGPLTQAAQGGAAPPWGSGALVGGGQRGQGVEGARGAQGAGGGQAPIYGARGGGGVTLQTL